MRSRPACLLIGSLLAVLSPVRPTVVFAQETQGVYLERLTVDEASQAIAYISTGNATEDLIVTNSMTGTVVFNQNVVASEQTNGPSPWINAEWSRSETLPFFSPGLYIVHVDPAAVTPSVVERKQNTYEMPLFVVPTTPTADMVLIFPSLTATCYNQWGGASCYSRPHQPDVGFKRPGVYKAYIAALKRVILRADVLGITWDAIDEQYIEDNPAFLQNYRAAVAVLQPEYVTLAMRDAYEDYMNSGGRLAILGNEAWIYQVRRAGDTYSVYKTPERLIDPFDSDGDPSNDHLIAYEWVRGTPVSNTTGPNRPETRVLGQSTWLGYDAAYPYWTAWRTGHWFHSGTGLSEGDPFRDGSSGGEALRLGQILGGVRTLWTGGLPFVRDGSIFEVPTNVLILATIPSPNARLWDCVPYWDAKDTGCWGEGTAAITIRQTENDGAVLVVPDHNWVFNVPGDTVATQITDNVLAAFADPMPLDVYAGYATAQPVPVITRGWSVLIILALMAAGAAALRYTAAL